MKARGYFHPLPKNRMQPFISVCISVHPRPSAVQTFVFRIKDMVDPASFNAPEKQKTLRLPGGFLKCQFA